MLNKLTHRIIFFVVLFVTLLVVSLLFIISNQFERHYLYSSKNNMLGNLEIISHVINSEHITKPKSLPVTTLKKIADSKNIRITVMDHVGTVLFDSDIDNLHTIENHLHRPEVQQALNQETGFDIRFSATVGYKMNYVAKKIDGYVIRGAKPLTEIHDELKSFRYNIFNIGLVTFICTLLLAVYVSYSVGKPIKEIVGFASQFARGNYSRRLAGLHTTEFIALQNSLNDMADRIVETLKDLELEKNRLLLTISSIHDGVALINVHGYIELANRRFVDLFLPGGHLSEKPYTSVINNQEIINALKESLNSDKTIILEGIKLDNDAFVSVVLNQIIDGDQSQGILMAVHDVSREKRLKQIKSDLVSNVSHELKTPVAIIKGYLETIKEHKHDPEITDMVIDKAIKNADRQTALINDIIKLNMIENAGDMPIENVDILEIVQNCLELLRPKIIAKNITVTTNLELFSKPLKANRFLVENIFYNLIDNGINYNLDNGRVEVFAESTEDEQKIGIRDTGIGIPEDAVERIFERFFRVDKGRSRNAGGTGLGLAIVKHSAELLGWNIDVMSGNGSTTFTLSF